MTWDTWECIASDVPKAEAYLEITLNPSHLMQIDSKFFFTVILLYSILISFRRDAVAKDWMLALSRADMSVAYDIQRCVINTVQ